MKILIVDDEELTRMGVIQSIKWDKFGIKEILQADDGLNGFAVALKNKPEIILCDIRMPRMDGIRLAEKLQSTLPESVVIFMSGYSDKEYLKAAIKLKAVNYIEKPLNPVDIQKAIMEGIERYHQNQRTIRSEAYELIEKTSRLAIYLTFPYKNKKELILNLLPDLPYNKLDSAYFTSFVVRGTLDEIPDDEQNRMIASNLHSFLKSYHLDCFYVCKYQKYLVFHVFGPSKLSKLVLNEIISYFRSSIMIYQDCFISFGQTVLGIAKVYQSYETAVLLMESSFFFDTKTILTPKFLENMDQSRNYLTFPGQNYIASFAESIRLKDQQKSLQILEEIYTFFYKNTNVLTGQAKDICYQLFAILQDAYRKMKIPDKGQLEIGQDTLISYLDQFYSFQLLYENLVEKVTIFFRSLHNKTEENSTIFLIKDYINKNYGNELLSVKDISEHVYLSTSYVCTVFKNETGKTLNQYITEFRIEMAKKMLQEPRYKISDISSRLGYSDANYFSKTFKKMVGLSPSEYRENILS